LQKDTMSKREVLEIMSGAQRPLFPDEVCRRLSRFAYRSSVYSYLFRLHKQGLLFRRRITEQIAYQISPRGVERLRFLTLAEKKNGGLFAGGPGPTSDLG
jgi:hypothetical protein